MHEEVALHFLEQSSISVADIALGFLLLPFSLPLQHHIGAGLTVELLLVPPLEVAVLVVFVLTQKARTHGVTSVSEPADLALSGGLVLGGCRLEHGISLLN